MPNGVSAGTVGVLVVARNLAYWSTMQSTLAYSRKLVALGRPLVIGTSRKSFLGKLTGREVGERELQ